MIEEEGREKEEQEKEGEVNAVPCISTCNNEANRHLRSQ